MVRLVCVCVCVRAGVYDSLVVSKHVTARNRPWFQSQYQAGSVQLNDLGIRTKPNTQSSVHSFVLNVTSSHLFTFNRLQSLTETNVQGLVLRSVPFP